MEKQASTLDRDVRKGETFEPLGAVEAPDTLKGVFTA